MLPLPVEGFGEWFADTFGWPHAAELPLGRALLEWVRGRCDLVLHGHRHVPAHWRLDDCARPLEVVNAGSSAALGAYRVFTHRGQRVQSSRWVQAVPAARPSPNLAQPVTLLQLV